MSKEKFGCEHGRPSGRMCPHCLGINQPPRIKVEGKGKTYHATWEMVKDPLYYVDCPHCNGTGYCPVNNE